MMHLSFEQALQSCPIVASLRGLRIQEAKAVGETLARAGITVLEVTVRSEKTLTGDLPEESLAIVKTLVDSLIDKVHIATGSILQTDDVDRLSSVGISTFMSPAYNPELVRHAANQGLTFVPGVETVSEAMSATLNGAHGLKLFPSVYHERDGRFQMRHTPGFVKYLSGFVPIPIIVSGDFAPTETVNEYRIAGASGINIGRHLYSSGVEQEELKKRAERFVEIVSRSISDK